MGVQKGKVVIIGAGLGGLFTGAILAQEGFLVTVLEKNATIGGGLQSFKRFGEVFDTGMHVIGGMREGGNIRRLCEYLGIYDEKLISHVNPQVSERIFFAEDGATYEIEEGRKGFVESLSRYFPDQHDNLSCYVNAIYRIIGEIPLYQLRPAPSGSLIHSDEFFMPADEFIASYISDHSLRSLVAYMNPLYSGRAGATPAFLHCLVSSLLINGSSRFAGGSELFANKLRDKIEANGGKVLTSEGVSSIQTEGRCITSLTTAKHNVFQADYYISDIHPSALIALLEDPSSLPKAYRGRLNDIPNTYSAFTVNFKFKPYVFPYIDHTGYYYDRYDGIWELGTSERPWPQGFLYMTPPERNQGKYSRKMIVTVPMEWGFVKRWEDTSFGHRTEEYEQWKASCAEAVIACLERIFPDFRSCIEGVNTASPLTIRDFYGAKEGCMGGYLKDSKNITLSHVPVSTKIQNLLLTGQCVNLHGFCGVPLTAINTSEAILGLNYILNKINA